MQNERSLLLLAGIFYALCLRAQVHQTWPAGPQLGATLDYLVGQLDKSEITSGFLLDKALNGLVEPAIYDGLRRDSVYLQPLTFGLLYVQARKSFVGVSANPLPPPTAYLDRISHYTGTDTIPLAALSLDYYRIKPEAMQANLFTLQNDQLHDVPGRTQCPYLPYRLCAFVPLVSLSAIFAGFHGAPEVPGQLRFLSPCKKTLLYRNIFLILIKMSAVPPFLPGWRPS